VLDFKDGRFFSSVFLMVVFVSDVFFTELFFSVVIFLSDLSTKEDLPVVVVVVDGFLVGVEEREESEAAGDFTLVKTGGRASYILPRLCL
jgi:hypothetical protein